MSEVINKVESVRAEQRESRQYLEYRAIERAEMRERKKSLAHMNVSLVPERGSEYIEMESPTKMLFEGVETEETEIWLTDWLIDIIITLTFIEQREAVSLLASFSPYIAKYSQQRGAPAVCG